MTDDGEEFSGSRRVPLPAVVLGGAGLLPPLLAIFARLSAGEGTPLARLALLAGLTYAALILSFLGGMWWGIAAIRRPSDRIGPWLVLAVMPSLAAFALLLLSGWFPGPAALGLAAAILLTLVVDRRLAGDGFAPRWWMRLRVPLSAGLAAATVVLAVLL